MKKMTTPQKSRPNIQNTRVANKTKPQKTKPACLTYERDNYAEQIEDTLETAKYMVPNIGTFAPLLLSPE